MYCSFNFWHSLIDFAQNPSEKLNTVLVFSSGFFETQTRLKSDQRSAINEKFVVQTIVIMNTKETTAHFWISGSIKSQGEIYSNEILAASSNIHTYVGITTYTGITIFKKSIFENTQSINPTLIIPNENSILL